MLYIVATPIGNLKDITLRALETLQTVDVILCEDTRHSIKLLNAHGIAKPLVSFHAYSNEKKVQEIVSQLLEGKNMALISDAGTPGISDPGYVLIQACQQKGIKVEPIPGASAFLTGLMASGLPINRFWYYGFLPAKKGRETLFKKMVEVEDTIVFYESPYRILKTLEKLAEVMPERMVTLARELTKMHEEFLSLPAAELYATFKTRQKILGEFVVIVAPTSYEREDTDL